MLGHRLVLGPKMSDTTPTMRLQTAILKFQDALAMLCNFACSIAMITLIVTFGWLVFGRYVLNVTPTWVEQLALLLVTYIAFLGAAVGVHERFHLGVALFQDLLPAKLKEFALFLIDGILAVFGGIMCFASLELFQFGWDTLLPMLNIPESFRSLSTVLFGGLIVAFAGLRVVSQILTWVQGPVVQPQQQQEEGC